MSFIFVLAKTYTLQYAEKAVAVSLLPQLLYLLYLRLKYIEDLTESLEMHYFSRPQEPDRGQYVRVLDYPQDVIIGGSGLLWKCTTSRSRRNLITLLTSGSSQTLRMLS